MLFSIYIQHFLQNSVAKPIKNQNIYLCINRPYVSPSIFKGVNFVFLKKKLISTYQAVTFQINDLYIYIYIYNIVIYSYIYLITFFIIEFRVVQGHLLHFSEIFQGCHLIFQDHVYNIHHW